jgi:hypothetical protein
MLSLANSNALLLDMFFQRLQRDHWLEIKKSLHRKICKGKLCQGGALVGKTTGTNQKKNYQILGSLMTPAITGATLVCHCACFLYFPHF